MKGGEQTSVGCNIEMQVTSQQPQPQRLRTMVRGRGRGKGGRRGRRTNEQIVEAPSQELEAESQNHESMTQSEEERSDKRGAKSEELQVSDPMYPSNPVTKVCSCLCVLKRLCTYVCTCVRKCDRNFIQQ